MSMTLAKPPINLAPPGTLSHLQWRATEWLYAFGPLRPEIVLDYFALSPFYERASNNEELKMQMHFARGGMEGVDVNEELKRFRGLQYKLEYAAPPGLFIIHRQQRTSPSQAQTTGVYYILNESVYQGPTLYTVLNERLLTAVHHMSKSISLIQDHKPTWNPTTTYDWDLKPPPASAIAHTATVTATANDAAGHLPVSTAQVTTGDTDETPIAIDDDAELPPATFNPIMYRALTGIAATLAPPPDKPLPPGQEAKEPVPNGARGSTPGEAVGGAVNGGLAGEGKDGAKGVRVGPSGLRKPKKAA